MGGPEGLDVEPFGLSVGMLKSPSLGGGSIKNGDVDGLCMGWEVGIGVGCGLGGGVGNTVGTGVGPNVG